MAVWQGVHLALLAAEALRVPDDESTVGETAESRKVL
jgi:hypothetical protein